MRTIVTRTLMEDAERPPPRSPRRCSNPWRRCGEGRDHRRHRRLRPRARRGGLRDARRRRLRSARATPSGPGAGARARRPGRQQRGRRPRRRPGRARDEVERARSRPPSRWQTRSATTPVLCVASDLRFTDTGSCPASRRVAGRERSRELIAGARRLGSADRSRRSTSPGPEPPDQDALICGDDLAAKELALELRRPPRGRSRDRRRPARQLPRARGDDRRDPEREQGLRRPRRPPPHRPAVSVTIWPVEGLPEIEAGDDLARADRGARPSSRTATCSSSRRRRSRRPRAAIVRLAEVEPSERARELAGDERPAPARGDPARSRRGSSAARPPLVIAETRHGFVCASAGVDASNAPEAGHGRAPARGSRRLGGAAARARCASSPAPRSA